MSGPGRDPWEPYVDPAEDAASMASLALAPEVERIAAELRARHYAERRGESEVAAATKVARWKRVETRPQGARRT
jgi:hypothetical protein